MHEVAQSVDPACRVVYADPLVLAHARALLTSSSEGRTAYIHADARDPRAILDDPAVRDVVDFGQPVALMLVALLHFIPDEDKPVFEGLELVPPGVVLVSDWRRAGSGPRPSPAEVNCYGGVARKL